MSLPKISIGGKQLPCYHDGAETFILYSHFLNEFNLADSHSLSTMQRRKNKVAGTDQHCPSGHLHLLKEAGLVSRSAKNVAVLTAGQARQLLQLYKVPVEDVGAEGSPREDPVVDLVAEGSPREDAVAEDSPREDAVAESSPREDAVAEGSPREDAVAESSPREDAVAEGSPREDAGVEADSGEPAPPPRKVAKMSGKKLQQLNVELHPGVGREMQCFTTFWMQDLNHKRGSPPLAETTVSKSRERLLSKSTIGHAMYPQ